MKKVARNATAYENLKTEAEHVIEAAKVPRVPPKLRAAIDQMAAVVSRPVGKPGALTDEQKATILEKRSDGLTKQEIATELGLTLPKVEWFLRSRK